MQGTAIVLGHNRRLCMSSNVNKGGIRVYDLDFGCDCVHLACKDGIQVLVVRSSSLRERGVSGTRSTKDGTQQEDTVGDRLRRPKRLAKACTDFDYLRMLANRLRCGE